MEKDPEDCTQLCLRLSVHPEIVTTTGDDKDYTTGPFYILVTPLSKGGGSS